MTKIESKLIPDPHIGFATVPKTWNEKAVLLELWKPQFGQPCCVIDYNDKIFDFTEGFLRDSGEWISKRNWESCLSFEHPIVFAPTLDLARAIVLNRKSK